MRVCLTMCLLASLLGGANSFAAVHNSFFSASPIPDAGVVGVMAGKGTLLIYGTDTPFIPRGFNSVGVLFPVQYASTMCTSMPQNAQRGLAEAVKRMTSEPDLQLLAMKEHWRANTVRFQVSQGALAYEHEKGLSAYTDMVLSMIHQARTMGMVTIVSMQAEGRSCTAYRPNHDVQKLPDRQTEQAWAQLATALGRDRGVILEVFNEPASLKACGSRKWKYWATGCGTEADEGMVTVGRYLRRLAPNNVLLFDGDGLPPMFTGFPASVRSSIPDNSGYVSHPYSYVDGPHGWDTRFGDLQATGSPVVVTEWNEVFLCKKELNQHLAEELVKSYLPARNIGLIVHSWDAPGAVFADRSFDPVDSDAKCPATGANLAYDEFWSEAGGAQPAPEVDISSIKMVDGRVDAVTVALASNGGKDGIPGPYIARSVDLLLARLGQVRGAEMLATMKLSTSAAWAHGSFTLATASGLSHGRFIVQARDSLTILVHYEGGATHEITYPIR